MKKAFIIFNILVLFLGCNLIEQRKYPVFHSEDNRVTGRTVITLPDGRRFQKIKVGGKIEDRFNWGVPFYEANGVFTHQIGRTRSGSQIYETEEEFCLFSFTPESSGGYYFDEAFEFPKPKAEEFGEVALSIKGEETILKDEVCIQAFLDRLLTREHDVKREAIDTIDKGGGTVTFYSREYPKLSFVIMIYREKDQKRYYIVDGSNLDWIECTDIIEQYLSEYFE